MSSRLLLAAFLLAVTNATKKFLQAKVYFWLVSLARRRAYPNKQIGQLLHLLLDVLLIVFIVDGVFLRFQFDSYCGWSMPALLRNFHQFNAHFLKQPKSKSKSKTFGSLGIGSQKEDKSIMANANNQMMMGIERNENSK